MSAARSSRTVSRSTFDPSTRISLLEGDADELEGELGATKSSFAEEIDKLRGEIAATRQVLTGILIAVTVASIMLAINLVVAG